MTTSAGFYYSTGAELLYAANAVDFPDGTRLDATQPPDGLVQGWHWFASEVDALVYWNLL